jgi:alpha-tubulin suppressor-like RCC1 family protein
MKKQHNKVMTEDGKVFAAGNNSNGKLGIQKEEYAQIKNFPIPMLVDRLMEGSFGSSRLYQIASSANVTLGVTEKGVVYSWYIINS